MRTQHEGVKDEVSMVVVSGLFLVGKLIGGNKLTEPRVFQIIEQGKKIQMSPLPGNPPFVLVNNEGLRYTIPDTNINKNITELYYRVTHPEEEATRPEPPLPPGQAPKIVHPIDPELN